MKSHSPAEMLSTAISSPGGQDVRQLPDGYTPPILYLFKLKCGALLQPDAWIFREGSRDSIPVEKCMFQRQTGLNGVLDLMEGETEFTPPAQGLSSPKKWILRGKYRDQCGSAFA